MRNHRKQLATGTKGTGIQHWKEKQEPQEKQLKSPHIERNRYTDTEYYILIKEKNCPGGELSWLWYRCQT